jgi:hypothetical protein
MSATTRKRRLRLLEQFAEKAAWTQHPNRVGEQLSDGRLYVLYRLVNDE